jgi:hypothetical protein
LFANKLLNGTSRTVLKPESGFDIRLTQDALAVCQAEVRVGVPDVQEE